MPLIGGDILTSLNFELSGAAPFSSPAAHYLKTLSPLDCASCEGGVCYLFEQLLLPILEDHGLQAVFIAQL